MQSIFVKALSNTLKNKSRKNSLKMDLYPAMPGRDGGSFCVFYIWLHQELTNKFIVGNHYQNIYEH